MAITKNRFAALPKGESTHPDALRVGYHRKILHAKTISCARSDRDSVRPREDFLYNGVK
jgi:hypothetical protein